MTESKSEVYKVKVNEFDFSFTREQIDAMDFTHKSSREYNIIKDSRSVNASLIEANATAKRQKLEVDGETFDIHIKDELDQMLDQLGFNAVAGKQLKEVKAPMPGLVLEVNVTEGQEVKEGDKILILVAMKMENSIMIQGDATIKKINVKAGQPVEKGQVLVELS